MGLIQKAMTLKELNRLDLSLYQKYLHKEVVYDFNRIAGNDGYYRLLNYLCQDKKLVFDVGTYKGASAIAMSSAKKVISYDIEDLRKCKKPRNVTFKLGDARQDDKLLKAELIFLDTAHDGLYEEQFLTHLRANDYMGIVIMDDIYLNPQMLRLWYSLPELREDVSELGHSTGTGIVYFGKKVMEDEE